MFAVINAVSFLFVPRYMPETRGRTLEELEDDFRSHDAAALPPRGAGRRARLLTATDARPRDSMRTTLTGTRRDRSLKRLESLRRRVRGVGVVLLRVSARTSHPRSHSHHEG